MTRLDRQGDLPSMPSGTPSSTPSVSRESSSESVTSLSSPSSHADGIATINDLGRTHKDRLRTIYADEYKDDFYRTLAFGYLVLIILYLCLGVLHLITQFSHEFENTAHWISIGLYFLAAISYVFIYRGHHHEEKHALETMYRMVHHLKN